MSGFQSGHLLIRLMRSVPDQVNPPRCVERARWEKDWASIIKRSNDTLSLLAGIDLLTGKVHALVRDRHRRGRRRLRLAGAERPREAIVRRSDRDIRNKGGPAARGLAAKRPRQAYHSTLVGH